MTPQRARRLLWVASILIVPLPYLFAVYGHVPVLRFALLGTVAATYSGFIDGSGMAWSLTSLMLAHAVIYAFALWVAAAIIARVLPDSARRSAVWGAVGMGALIALSFDIYHTPFAAESAWTSWLGLLR